MTRRAILVSFALVNVAACGRKGARSSDFDSATAAALAHGNAAAATTAGLPRVGHIMALVLAHGLDNKQLPYGGAADTFKPGDSILVSVRTVYAPIGSAITLRLRQGPKLLDSITTKTILADSNGVAFAGAGFGQPKPLASGTYQVEGLLDGKFQVATTLTIKQP